MGGTRHIRWNYEETLPPLYHNYNGTQFNKSIAFPHEQGGRSFCEGTEGLRRKVWNRTKILSPNICYIVAVSWFVAIYALFGRLWAKKSALLGQKQFFLGKKCPITWQILHFILNWICKFAVTCKNDAFVAKIANTCLTKTCVAIFTPFERLPASSKKRKKWSQSYHYQVRRGNVADGKSSDCSRRS